MSAFIVSKKTYQKVANVLDVLVVLDEFKMDNIKGHMGMSALEFVNRLVDMNYEAVNQRYNEDNHNQEYITKTHLVDLKSKVVLQCIKYLYCISYQCFEGDVLKTKLYKKLMNLIRLLEFLYICHYTDYQDLKWG